MQSDRATVIENQVDRTAAALFALAAGYAAYTWSSQRWAEPVSGVATGAVALIAFWLCVRGLSAVQPRRRKLPIPVFDLREMDASAPDELLLTERFEAQELLLTERLQAEPAAGAEPLVLDDILEELGPDSRVVRLFDPAAMPTPGQLNDRIERHLVRDPPPATCNDASQALHEALAELRRSLR
jgi:hypothetical protein